MTMIVAGPLEEAARALRIPRAHHVRDASCGLEAVIVVDDTTLGPAAGGVRTRAYPTPIAAVEDAARLARAMTIKCSLAGLDAGGGKAVVLDHAGLDRPRAFRALGAAIEALGGDFRTAGDLGTRPADLAAMAETTRYVHTDERDLAAAVARGLVGCVDACVRARYAAWTGLRVAVQGAGAIGAAVARALAAVGAHVFVADLDAARAEALAAAVGGSLAAPSEILELAVDVLVPCAIGSVIDEAVAARVSAWAVCGAANNLLAGERAAQVLHERGVLVVPDVLASAGAVIDGIGASVMHLADRGPLIAGLAATAAALLEESRATGRTTTELAHARARARIAARRA